MLDAVQKKLHQASNTIDEVQVRSRAIGRKLKDVQELPPAEAVALPPLDTADDEVPPADDDGAEDNGNSGAGRPVSREAAG